MIGEGDSRRAPQTSPRAVGSVRNNSQKFPTAFLLPKTKFFWNLGGRGAVSPSEILKGIQKNFNKYLINPKHLTAGFFFVFFLKICYTFLMNEILSIAGQYGALGLMLIASFWYINKKDGDHKIEREEMNGRFNKQHEEALEVTKTNTSAMIELTTVIKSNK